MKRRRLIVRGTLFALAGWSFGFEPGWLQQRRLTLEAATWQGSPLTVAVASDLHVGAPLRHAYDWIPEVPAPTYVSSGIGTSTLPIRFNCPPETLVLRLSGKETS